MWPGKELSFENHARKACSLQIGGRGGSRRASTNDTDIKIKL
jgi:hypothetical protein